MGALGDFAVGFTDSVGKNLAIQAENKALTDRQKTLAELAEKMRREAKDHESRTAIINTVIDAKGGTMTGYSQQGPVFSRKLEPAEIEQQERVEAAAQAKIDADVNRGTASAAQAALAGQRSALLPQQFALQQRTSAAQIEADLARAHKARQPTGAGGASKGETTKINSIASSTRSDLHKLLGSTKETMDADAIRLETELNDELATATTAAEAAIIRGEIMAEARDIAATKKRAKPASGVARN